MGPGVHGRWGGWRMVLGMWLWPFVAAYAGPRVATVFEEQVDGVRQPVSAAEGVLLAELGGKVRLLDEAQARRIRSTNDAGRLVEGGIAPVITTLDADVIVAGVCRAERMRSDLLGERAARVEATLDLRIVAVDSGEVIASLSTRGGGLDFTPLASARKAAAEAAKAAAPAVLAALARASTASPVDLTVEGCPDVSTCERVIHQVRALPGVDSVDVGHAGRGATLMSISSALTARELALRLDDSMGTGVSVTGYSSRVIRARYAIERAVQLKVIQAPLRREAGRPTPWRGETLAGVIGTALSNAPFVEVVTEVPGVGDVGSAGGARAVMARMPGALLMTGSFQAVGEQLHIEARLLASPDATPILRGEKTCPREPASACAAELGTELTRKLPAVVLARRELLGGHKPSPAGALVPALEITSVAVENVFPSRRLSYARAPIGTVQLRNRGQTEVARVVVTAELIGFSEGPTQATIDHLAGGDTVEVPLRVALDPTALDRQIEHRPAALRIEVLWRSGELESRQVHTQPLVVHDRHALAWTQPDSAASFISPRSPATAALARNWTLAVPEGQRREPLARLAALWRGYGVTGVRYVPDAVNPFGAQQLDSVQYADETLAGGGGDCDDLAVVIASAAEAVGIHALLLITPDHVLPALDTGFPAQAAWRLTQDPNELVEHGGRLFLPLEATMIGKPFDAAWRSAATTVARWNGRPGQLTRVDVRAAWTRFPPAEVAVPAPDASHWIADASAIVAELGSIGSDRKAAWENTLSRIDHTGTAAPERENLRGRVLVAMGRLDEAAGRFATAARDAQRPGLPLNNAANLHLMAGRLAEATAAYDTAIAREPRDARIRINAALAAWMAGDELRFADRILECLDLGGGELVDHLAAAGLAPGAGTRGAKADGGRAADLREALERVYARARRALPARRTERATEANADDVLELLFWI